MLSAPFRPAVSKFGCASSGSTAKWPAYTMYTMGILQDNFPWKQARPSIVGAGTWDLGGLKS